MQNIRKEVFETNSSSTHSISISKDTTDLMDTLYPNNLGEIEFTGGEFGWEEEEYTDPETKANYVATMLMHLKDLVSYYEEHKNEEDRFKYYSLPEFAAKNYITCLSNFEEVIKEQTGASKVVILASSDYSSPYHAYIDHQSFENKSDAEWLLDKEKIRNFIFNPKSILITDNDNH